MWPFSRTVPQDKHESCRKLIGTLSERVEMLELASAERHLQVLDVCEKLSERLKDRVRKREPQEPVEPPAAPPRPWERFRLGGR